MNVNKLRGKFVEHGYTISTMAKELGISHTAMSNKINGKSQFTQGEMSTMASKLKMSKQEITDIFFADQVS